MKENKINIIFRCDGNSTIGLGHVFRSLALAEYLESDFYITFAINPKTRLDLIPDTYKVISIPEEISLEQEPVYFAENLEKSLTIFVLDGYHFNEKYIQLLHNNFCVVYIDDMHPFRLSADLIINHSGGFKQSDIKGLPLSRICIGPDYAIVRKVFLKQTKSISFDTDVLICFGGADPMNFTRSVILNLDKSLKISVVIGSAYQFKEELKLIENEQLKVYQNLDAISLSALMEKSACAIMSSSTIAYEYLASSLGKLFVIRTADNQEYLYKYLISSKAASAYTGKIEKSEEGCTIIDGDSPNRILKEFKFLEKELCSDILKAKIENCDLVYNWINDPDVRSQSFNQHEISYPDHLEWFRQKINSESVSYFLIRVDNEFVGQIRFEISDSKATISYLTAPDFRGKGWGSVILKKGVLSLIREKEFIKEIVGFVKATNKASRNSFIRCNFREEETSVYEDSVLYRLIL